MALSALVVFGYAWHGGRGRFGPGPSGLKAQRTMTLSSVL